MKCILLLIIAFSLTAALHSSFNKITNQLNYYLTWYNNYLYTLLSNVFSIDKVAITGNKFTNEKDILNLINKAQPIIYISLSNLANDIQSQNKWIKYVRIYRILPNTLHINVHEHKLLTPWGNNDKTLVIDHEGKLIVNSHSIDKLIVITG
ncbi:cell division protein FtsQ/DivIB [Wolbachia endosymbiont of Cruorifilaria tuberocauda]|uniref:cell division protein FtsQ/DivIB n=1 Tax=Wolbachia endosymbiont of Cruorifilaria tuberocauda TaxID=1812111 RepID=UPI001FE49F88|nr:FtsQ-type POTRA domain-containing protein [Wolbachia endosymbiont of Cruorifilaria tuberocauda]